MNKEDVTLSFLRSLAEVQGHLAHVHALSHQVRKIYFIGGFINMELMRRYLYEEICSRNLMRPEVITNLRFTSIIVAESGFPRMGGVTPGRKGGEYRSIILLYFLKKLRGNE